MIFIKCWGVRGSRCGGCVVVVVVVLLLLVVVCVCGVCQAHALLHLKVAHKQFCIASAIYGGTWAWCEWGIVN